MSQWKEGLEAAICGERWHEVADSLRDHPSGTRVLISGLHTTDSKSLERILHSFSIAARVLERERLLDLTRRLMWLLNEESGNNCPNAALALATIAPVVPEAVLPHVPVLRIYADDPSDLLRTTVRLALERIEENCPTDNTSV